MMCISERRARPQFISILIVSSICLLALTPCQGQQPKRPFTIADEIGLRLFNDSSGTPAEICFSPDENYFAVWTERGRLDLNRPEDSLRFYRSQDVLDFLAHSDRSRPPSPVWVVIRTTSKVSPTISQWRWLADSSGMAFLEHMASGNQRLVIADLRTKAIEPLTYLGESIADFDISDRNNYVYTIADPMPAQKMRHEMSEERQVSAIVGTGRSPWELFFPDDPLTGKLVSKRKYLWAVIDGKRFNIKHDSMPLVLFGGVLVLSPDGASLVTTLPVPEVPLSWETLYPPPFASDPFRIRAGHLDTKSGDGSANQYVLVNLRTGSVQALTSAPSSSASGWWTAGNPSWSSDGHEILLPGTFINSKDQAPSRPCIAVVNLPARTCTCVEALKGQTETGFEEGYHAIRDAQFVNGDKRRVMVKFHNHGEDWSSIGTTEYQHTIDDTWQVIARGKDKPKVQHNGLEVRVEQAFDEPPRLIAKNTQTSRVIWDPNPQLKDYDLGQASVYHWKHKWKGKEGPTQTAGLYMPSNYEAGHRYPLVIQTHGFTESEFRPSGAFPTAFAARALAAAGIVVVQVQVDDCPNETPDEGPCTASAYESVANQLVSQGLVDSERTGIIGFSSSCFGVMELLTTGSSRLRAASITDGYMVDYFQYLITAGTKNISDMVPPFFRSLIGTEPSGDGLQEWLKRSPGFNLDKINTPLMVVGLNRPSLATMWQPYAGLLRLHKPVELVMMNTDEHILTNPSVRMASQGGSVDWFRFWLKDEEDSDPVKAEQYIRWRALRQLQRANEIKLTVPHSAMN